MDLSLGKVAINIFILLLIKAIIFLSLLYKFGFIYGTIIMVISTLFYHKILEVFFGLKTLNGYDKVFVTNYPIGRYQIITQLRFSNFNPEKLKTFFIEKLLKKVPKLRYKLKYSFLEFYWKEINDISEALEKVMIKPKLKNEEELTQYIHKELNKQIDIFEEIPYEVHILQVGDDETKGVALLKYDHILSDGLGLVTSLCMISDNFTEEMYPKIMRNMKEPRWYELIYLWIVFPFYCSYITFYFYLYRPAKNPFRAVEKPMSNNSQFLLSNSFKLKDFEKYRKTNKVSFNDIMMTSFSIAMKKVLSNSPVYKNKKNLVIDLPVGRKEIPKLLQNVAIINEASGVLVDIPLIEDEKEMKKVTKGIRAFFKPEIQFSLGIGADLLGEIVPWKLLEFFSAKFAKTFDFLFTNVPGPTMKLIYGDCICEDMVSFPASGGGMPFVTILSFNGQFKFVLSSNENADWGFKDLMNEYENVLKKFII